MTSPAKAPPFDKLRAGFLAKDAQNGAPHFDRAGLEAGAEPGFAPGSERKRFLRAHLRSTLWHHFNSGTVGQGLGVDCG
jgi:hypothetical protein